MYYGRSHTHWVLELIVHFRDDGSHALELREHILLVANRSPHHGRHLVQIFCVKSGLDVLVSG